MQSPADNAAPVPAAHGSLRAGAASSVYLTLFLLLAIGLDAFRIGFFADDFHFLDVAGRVPLLRLLAGARGLWPWYRPLSRELYFWIVAHSGPFALPVAHLLGVLVFSAVLILIWRIGTRLLPAAAVAIAIGLFTVSDISRFVLAYPSGFQDLFALFWILVALDAHMIGRRRRAAIAALLAPLAKETGFLVFPLLLALDFFVMERRSVSRWLGYGIAALVDVAIHVVVRCTWPAAAHSSPSVSPSQIEGVAAETIRGLVAAPPTRWPGAWAIVGSVAAVSLLDRLSRSTSNASTSVSPTRVNSFLLVSAGLGVLPTLVAYGLRAIKAHPYHFFPASPWICLLLGILIERRKHLGQATVAGLLLWNLIATAYVPPDLSRAESWASGPMNWKWAVRLSAESRSIGADLRRELQARPESLVVLYESIPWDSYLQTEDGPATRVLLHDPTVHAYFLNAPPALDRLRSDRLQILTFDTARLHLRKVDWSEDEILLRAMKAAIADRPDVATILLAFRPRSDSVPFDRDYVDAAARLERDGPRAYLDELRRAGDDDTSGTRPAQLSRVLGGLDHGLGAAMEAMLRTPLSADAHAALGDTMAVRDVLPGAALELRVALALDPAREADRWRLALLMLKLGGAKEALVELDELARDPRSGPLGEQAQALETRVRSALPSEN